jgi:hypothetical protein
MTIRQRQAILQLGDATYRDKQESLDFLDQLQREKRVIHGIEVVAIQSGEVQTSMYKTIWFNQPQKQRYIVGRQFLKEKMSGMWNYAEFKLI